MDAIQRPPYMVYRKMDRLVQDMHDTNSGLPSKSFKNLISVNASTFAGTDLVTWFVNQLHIDEPEAIHLGSMLCLHGYIFPVNGTKNVLVKDSGILYRFQTPYFWPSLNWRPDDVDYAIYLAKRSLRRNKIKHGLDEQEQATLLKLQKVLCDKWDFICQQAQEQVKLLKQRKKADRLIVSSQERAFWQLQRPSTQSPINGTDGCKKNIQNNSNKKTIENIKKQIDWLTMCLKLPRMKSDKVCESFLTRCEMYAETDPFLVAPLPSNPWITDDTTVWDMDTLLVDALTERRVKKWSFGMEEVLRDPAGFLEFERFLASEFSSENIKFWLSVQKLKTLPLSKVDHHAQHIYRQFLEQGAESEINIDSKTMIETVKQLNKPHRLMYDAAQTHIYLLMKKDSYPRFIKSDNYKNLLSTAFVPTSKKKFFAFSNKKRSPHPSPGKTKRRGSASGEVAVEQNHNHEDHLSTNSLSQHSYSTGNLKDIDSDKSSEMSAYGSTGNVQGESHIKSKLSPSALKKKLKDLIHSQISPTQSVHNLEVPASHQPINGAPGTASNSSGTQSKGSSSPNGLPVKPGGSGLVLSVPSPTSGGVRSVSNVVAPWEDEI